MATSSKRSKTRSMASKLLLYGAALPFMSFSPSEAPQHPGLEPLLDDAGEPGAVWSLHVEMSFPLTVQACQQAFQADGVFRVQFEGIKAQRGCAEPDAVQADVEWVASCHRYRLRP